MFSFAQGVFVALVMGLLLRLPIERYWRESRLRERSDGEEDEQVWNATERRWQSAEPTGPGE